MLDLFMEELTPNLDKSKQFIKILLKELQALQSSLQKVKAECECHKTIKSVDESEIIEDDTSYESNDLETEWIDIEQTGDNESFVWSQNGSVRSPSPMSDSCNQGHEVD